LLAAVCDVAAVGQVLLYIDKQTSDTEDNNATGNINIIKVPTQYYARTRNNSFYLLPETE